MTTRTGLDDSYSLAIREANHGIRLDFEDRAAKGHPFTPSEYEQRLQDEQHAAAVEARNWGSVARDLIGARDRMKRALEVKGTFALGPEQRAVLRKVRDSLGPMIHDVCREQDYWEVETKRLNKLLLEEEGKRWATT